MTQAEQDLRVDYVEFGTSDIAGTKRFYVEVFGWEFTDYGPEYTSFSDGRLAGGFHLSEGAASEGGAAGEAQPDEVMRGGALVVIYALDIEAALASVRGAGGQILKDIFTFPGGRRFHFADPGGNELAVWSDQ